jgi:glutathione S-transferase
MRETASAFADRMRHAKSALIITSFQPSEETGMKLYYAPGACSIGIHVLLEEIGKPYQLEPVNLRDGAQFKPPFNAVSPKAKVPALERDDGSVLTEFPVIARWLGRQANLLPKDDEADTRAMEAMEYAVGTMHGQGLRSAVPLGTVRAVSLRPGRGKGRRPRGRRKGLCRARQSAGRQALYRRQ